MRVAVLGAGNGGQASAAHLALLGHRVTLYDRFPDAVSAFQDDRRLTVTGAVEGLAEMELVTSDLADCLAAGADVILVSLPAFALEWLAEAVAPLVSPGTTFVLHPGGTGGALRVRELWRALGAGEGVLLAETETLVYACRLAGPGRPDIKAVKRSVSLAALPASATAQALQLFSTLYPQARAANSVLETGLANLNPVMHPAIVLGNARAVEHGVGFDFYGEGVSPGIAALIDAVDRERVAIAARLSVDHVSLYEWVARAYGVRATDTVRLCRTMSEEVYRGIRSPDGLSSRYVVEDVPYGLVPWSELGRACGVVTPVIDAMIEITSVLSGADHRAEGRRLEKLGLDGLDAIGLRRAVA